MKIAFFLLAWAVTVWLVYPLLTMKDVDLQSATTNLYRSSAGILIMLVMFGKTVADLLFPHDLSRKKSVAFVSLLFVYAIVLAVGIIVILLRILGVYLKNNPIGG